MALRCKPEYKLAGVLPSVDAGFVGSRLILGGNQFGDFVGVQSGTFSKVVSDHEKVDGVVEIESLANATNKGWVLASHVSR